MHIKLLVEEPSAQAASSNLIPKIIGGRATFSIHVHQGKHDLLSRLPQRLKGYRHWLPSDWRIVILVDADEDDCRELKFRMVQAAREAGLISKSGARSGRGFQVIDRQAIEELEAWFFGDDEALGSTTGSGLASCCSLWIQSERQPFSEIDLSEAGKSH
jgi:hypothetical protein